MTAVLKQKMMELGRDESGVAFAFTVTVSPGSALPQTGTAMSRCSTALSENTGASSTFASTSNTPNRANAPASIHLDCNILFFSLLGWLRGNINRDLYIMRRIWSFCKGIDRKTSEKYLVPPCLSRYWTNAPGDLKKPPFHSDSGVFPGKGEMFSADSTESALLCDR